jgi:hypothetical protein
VDANGSVSCPRCAEQPPRAIIRPLTAYAGSSPSSSSAEPPKSLPHTLTYSALHAPTGVASKAKASNGHLIIRIRRGRSLMICDPNGFSDPYCMIFMGGLEYRTQTIWKTLDPVFEETFTIPLDGATKDIQIGVYDEDKYSGDDFMGMIGIPISELQHEKVLDDWFPLTGRPGKSSDKSEPISGALHLEIVMTERYERQREREDVIYAAHSQARGCISAMCNRAAMRRERESR